MAKLGRTLLTGFLLVAATRVPATAAAVLSDQSDLATPIDSINISALAVANGFTVLRKQRVQMVDLFLSDSDGSTDGVFSKFNGAIGWAIFDNGASGHPGALVASGSDLAPVVTDTGVDLSSNDVFRVRITLDPAVPLDSGSWWLAVHEGTWGSPYDTTPVSWVYTETTRGLPAEFTDPSPSVWNPLGGDTAFVVYGSEVIEADEPACCLSVDISLGVWATPFANPGGLRPTQLLTWLLDGTVDDDGELGAFSGTLGWAIYADGGATPTGDPIASGQDTAPRMTDTGTNLGSVDLVRVAIDLDGVPALGGGTYWLALHEGAWGSPYDASAIRWLNGSAASGTTAGSWQVAAPEGSWTQDESWSSALVLFPPEGEADELIYASGFEAGVACAWSSAVGGTLCP